MDQCHKKQRQKQIGKCKYAGSDLTCSNKKKNYNASSFNQTIKQGITNKKDFHIPNAYFYVKKAS